MPRVIAVGFFLLIEMEIHEQIFPGHFHVGMESWVSGAGERSDEAHFLAIFALESISGPTKNRYGIIGRFGDDDFHDRIFIAYFFRSAWSF